MADDILIQGKTYPHRVNEKGEAFVTTSANLTDYEQVSSVLAYVWIRPAGTLDSTASSQVKKLVFNAAGDVTTTCADGNLNFDNVWADRASLTYS